jgi:ADP-heptose:LPS heptosyltransferase
MSRRLTEILVRRRVELTSGGLLLALILHLASFIPWREIFANTLTVGGDTPAHAYLVSQLTASLASSGSIISWAPGWWCGFPLFQFYFPFPYLLIAGLGTLIPPNIAFKLVTVSGILIFPVCAWALGRLLRLPRPVPDLFAILALPFLFVHTHVMWGANIYSLLAGMIANSLSFPLMLLVIGLAYRDAEDGRFRLRTTVLFAVLIGSHFFTVVIAALTLAILPFLWPRRFWKTVGILAAEGGLAALLMAWWLVPLMLKSGFSADFGANWKVALGATFPAYKYWMIPLILTGIWMACRRRERPFFLLVWMFLLALALFQWGFRLSPVFVNVRLWPFLFFAGLALAAVSAGFWMTRLRAPEFFLAAFALSAMLYVEHAPLAWPEWIWSIHDRITETRWGNKLLPVPSENLPPYPPNQVREWARWNYSGLEKKPYYSVFEKLVFPLRGTPGRLTYDLNEENNVLGSVRIFESVPPLIGKPILEGGIVNSALGSYYSYYVQGEVSTNCAGFPTLVKPTTFQPTNATQHLALFNVKHCIARWAPLKKALHHSPDWKFIAEEKGWELFELLTHSGNLVYIPNHYPVAVRTERRKEFSLEWLYAMDAIQQPFVFTDPDDPMIPPHSGPPLSEDQFRQFIAHRRGAPGNLWDWLRLGPFPCPSGRPTPLDTSLLDAALIDPVEGSRTAGHIWTRYFDAPPSDLYPIFQGMTQAVVYFHANLFVPAACDARLQLAQDDLAQVWLNGALIAQVGRADPAHPNSVDVHFIPGRNRLLVKIFQDDGGSLFQVRVTDQADNPLPGLIATAANHPPPLPTSIGQPVNADSTAILHESVEPNRIRFETRAIGLPHIVKISFFPNWQVRGARRVYWVTPDFLLVYPDQAEVEIYYGATGADRIGYALTWLGLALFITLVLAQIRRNPGPLAFLVGRPAFLKFTDALLGLPLCWILGYTHHWFNRRPPASDPLQPHTLRRILILRPGGMGDMILLLPILHRLRQALPEAHLTLVCERRNLEVLHLANWDSSIIAYDAKPFQLIRLLAGQPFDVVLDTEQFHHFSAILSLLSRAPVRIGFKINPARNQLYTHLINYTPDAYEGAQFARLLEPLRLPDAPPLPALEGCLAQTPLPPVKSTARIPDSSRTPSIVLAPGGSTPYKQWGVGRFAELIRQIQSIRPELRIVLLGGPGDRRECEEILRDCGMSPASLVSLAGGLSLAETAAVIRAAGLFIGGDSGLGHLAVALGTPTVLLFGPSDHQKWGHAGVRHAVIRRPVACAPCFIFGYHRPCRTIACMRGITVDQVVAAARQLLIENSADHF